jgi:hypothetical protein
MARKIKIFVSKSAAATEVDAFLSALLVLVLKINQNDTKAFKLDFKNWTNQISNLLGQLKIKKEFTRIANTFLLKDDFSEEDAVFLGRLLKSNKVYFEQDVTITFDQLSLYKDISSSLATDSQPAWKRIEKNVSKLNNPKLSHIFLPEPENLIQVDIPVETAVKKAKALALKLTGRSDKVFLTPKELAAIRLEQPDLLSQYATFIKVVNKVVKAETLKFVRSSGKDRVPLVELKEYLKQRGIANNLPTGFTGGQIDEQGKMYTREGRQLDKIPFGLVQMNANYDPESDNTYVLKSLEMHAVYRTLTFLSGNKSARHEAVKDFYSQESAHRNTWITDLSKPGSKEQILSAMVEILYQTACRIGGKDNATKGEPTYGLSTLLVKHVKFNPTKVEFNYSGKKLAEQHHELRLNTPENKKIGELLKTLVAKKRPDDLVFTYGGKTLGSNAVRTYLKEKGVTISPHRFRQLAGTKATMGILSKSPFKASAVPKQAEVDRWVKKELEKVGEVLHHRTGTKVTGMTAVKSYISPEVLVEFYNKLNLRVPNWVPV